MKTPKNDKIDLDSVPKCVNGHPKTPENLTNNGRCRKCKNASKRKRRSLGVTK